MKRKYQAWTVKSDSKSEITDPLALAFIADMHDMRVARLMKLDKRDLVYKLMRLEDNRDRDINTIRVH